MPIIHMASKREEIPAHAVNIRMITERTHLRNPETGNYDIPGTHDIWLYDTHVGLCIQDHERNGRDDSDFYMTVWNPEKGEAEDIFFATTRGWSYPCYGSAPDATPEVMAAYNAWRTKKARDYKCREFCERRKIRREIAAKAGISVADVMRLERALLSGSTPNCPQGARLMALYRSHIPGGFARFMGINNEPTQFERVAKLLTSKLRSPFRKRLAEQVRAWLADPSPKYQTPLSRKQLEYV